MSQAPAEIYRQRLEERKALAAREQRQHITIGNVRLLVGIGAAAIAWMVFAQKTLPGWCLLLPVLAFVPLAVWHERVVRRRAMADRAARFYERGLARIEDRWTGTGEPGDEFEDPEHPYAADLDLFGKGSLFELLNAARTHGGEERLASWLKGGAARETILARQEAVTELREKLDLREHVFTLGEEARGKLRSRALVDWAESPAVLPAWRGLALAANVLLLAGFLFWSRTGLVTGVMLAGAATAAVGFLLRPRVLAVLVHVEEAVEEISLLRGLLRRLEVESFSSELPRRLSESLRGLGEPPSVPIARLYRLKELIDSRDNVAMRTIGPPLLYGTHLAFAVERWKARNGPQVRRWIDAVSEMEALLSLAAYSYEHPADPFPEIAAERVFDGEQLGHPLLEASKCVRNPAYLAPEPRLLVISGSNMSGKSTYLRTVGINAVLAMAGGVVRAGRLRLCPLAVGASIRINDSLQGGSSRFYAEITRLKQIVDLTVDGGGALFLLDEFLGGTNSHDRRIGAEGVLRALVARGALGMVTTHDLALTAIAENLGPAAANFHFEDTMRDGRLIFDYRLRPGVVLKSNALELMRSIGLEV